MYSEKNHGMYGTVRYDTTNNKALDVDVGGVGAKIIIIIYSPTEP